MAQASFKHLNMTNPREGWTPDRRFIDYSYEDQGALVKETDKPDQQTRDAFAELGRFVVEQGKSDKG